MPIEQDITLPFTTVNKHKVSNSCFRWGLRGMFLSTWPLLCSFGMPCLLITERVCIFSYTKWILFCFHVCSGTPFNSISSCYFLSPWKSFSYSSILFLSNIYIFFCLVPSPSLKEPTVSLAHFLFFMCLSNNLLFIISSCALFFIYFYHSILDPCDLFLYSKLLCNLFEALILLVVLSFTFSLCYLVIHSGHLIIEVCQVASNLCLLWHTRVHLILETAYVFVI